MVNQTLPRACGDAESRVRCAKPARGRVGVAELLVFLKQRLVVLANTKTGSTSIEAALEGLADLVVARPDPLRHTTADTFRRHVAPWLAAATGETGFETAALVREPLDWLGSWYRDRAATGLLPEGMDFAGFGRAVLSTPTPEPARLVSQTQMLCDDTGRPIVDALFRFDAIGHFVTYLEDRIGCAITLPRLRVSPAAPTDLDPALRAALERHFAADAALHAAARG